METLKKGQRIELHERRFEVFKRPNGKCFLNDRDGLNSTLFEKLNIDRRELSISVLGYHDGGYFPWCRNLKDLTKLVKAIKDYKKSVEVKDERFPFNLKYKSAQSIIDIACGVWKNKLFDKWGESIVLKRDISISKEQYKEMRLACTSAQHSLFDEIFGKDEKRIHVVGDTYIKDGDISDIYMLIFEGNGDRTGDPIYGIVSMKTGKVVVDRNVYCKDGQKISDYDFNLMAGGEGSRYTRQDFNISPSY